MKLSNRIRQVRTSYKLTQADVANEMNISTSTYGQIERNASKARCETLERVADAIGVSFVFLLDIHSDQFIELKNRL